METKSLGPQCGITGSLLTSGFTTLSLTSLIPKEFPRLVAYVGEMLVKGVIQPFKDKDFRSVFSVPNKGTSKRRVVLDMSFFINSSVITPFG